MLKLLHIVFITGTLLLVLYADEEALQYVLGKKSLNLSVVRFLHYAVALGLGGIVITGGLLYARTPAYYLSDPTFITKMIAVAALIVNSAFLDRFSQDAEQKPFAAHSLRERSVLLVSGTVSGAGWITALICGLLLG